MCLIRIVLKVYIYESYNHSENYMYTRTRKTKLFISLIVGVQRYFSPFSPSSVRLTSEHDCELHAIYPTDPSSKSQLCRLLEVI